jgi:hypothetical protein
VAVLLEIAALSRTCRDGGDDSGRLVLEEDVAVGAETVLKSVLTDESD